jgi:hypothetical protein
MRTGPRLATSLDVSEAADRIRVEYIMRSVERVCRMAFVSRDDARVAAGELRQYFGWVRNALPPRAQESLTTQIDSLCMFLGAPRA